MVFLCLCSSKKQRNLLERKYSWTCSVSYNFRVIRYSLDYRLFCPVIWFNLLWTNWSYYTRVSPPWRSGSQILGLHRNRCSFSKGFTDQLDRLISCFTKKWSPNYSFSDNYLFIGRQLQRLCTGPRLVSIPFFHLGLVCWSTLEEQHLEISKTGPKRKVFYLLWIWLMEMIKIKFLDAI